MSCIDIIIVCIFLCSTLYVGLRSGRNIKTFKDYAIGNRKFSDFVIFFPPVHSNHFFNNECSKSHFLSKKKPKREFCLPIHLKIRQNLKIFSLFFSFFFSFLRNVFYLTKNNFFYQNGPPGRDAS